MGHHGVHYTSDKPNGRTTNWELHPVTETKKIPSSWVDCNVKVSICQIHRDYTVSFLNGEPKIGRYLHVKILLRRVMV